LDSSSLPIQLNKVMNMTGKKKEINKERLNKVVIEARHNQNCGNVAIENKHSSYILGYAHDAHANLIAKIFMNSQSITKITIMIIIPQTAAIGNYCVSIVMIMNIHGIWMLNMVNWSRTISQYNQLPTHHLLISRLY